MTVAAPAADLHRLQVIRERIKQQRADQPQTSYSLHATQRLVETAMLAAVSGLSYALATTMHLEGYLGYFLPLPVILSALRSGPAAGRKTMTATFFLVLILLGPVKALTYVFTHGITAATLGVTWARRWGWAAGIGLGAVARLTGYVGFLAVSCWVTRENLFALMITSSCSTIDQVSALVGHSGTVSPGAVITVICCLLVVNAVFYLGFMHLVYHILLTNMGYNIGRPPRLAERFLRI